MTDYQFIHFLACDAPLGKKQIAIMRKQAFSYDTDLAARGPLRRKQSQSVRITEWEFIDEYRGEFNGGNFFGGNHWEMLRQGYDAHLDYISIGIRILKFHLPDGAPCGHELMTAFELAGGVEWHADHNYHGPLAEDEWTMPGILCLDPLAENNDADNKAPLDLAPLLRQIVPVRKMLARGDVRPLYLAWLAGYLHGTDEDELEPPVPAGLCSLTPPLQAMATFFALAPELIAAAAARSPALPDEPLPATPWPMAEPARSITQLRKAAASLRGESRQRQRQRQEVPSSARIGDGHPQSHSCNGAKEGRDAESQPVEAVLKSDGKPSHSKESEPIHSRSLILSAPGVAAGGLWRVAAGAIASDSLERNQFQNNHSGG